MGFTGGWIGLVVGYWIIPFSIILPLVVGTLKELYDMRTTGFDWRDLLADMIGAAPAVVIWVFISMLEKSM